MFHFTYVSEFVYTFISQWMFELFHSWLLWIMLLCVGEHRCISISLRTLHSFGYIPRGGMAGSYGNSNFLRNCRTISHKGCTILYPHDQLTRVPVSPYSCQYYYFLFVVVFCLLVNHLLVVVAILLVKGFFGGSDDKESTCNAGYLGLTPGLGRSPRERNDNLIQYSCLDNSRGVWWTTVHGRAKGQTCLNNFNFQLIGVR